MKGLWFVGGAGISAGSYAIIANGESGWLEGCVLDQFGFDIGLFGTIGGPTIGLVGCEIFSSQGGSGGVNASIYTKGESSYFITALSVIGCNIHDTVGYGIYCDCTNTYNSVALTVLESIVAKCGNSGIYVDTYNSAVIKNNTIDANAGDGITFGPNLGFWGGNIVVNNIISNHIGVGKFGVNTNGTSTAANNGANGQDFNTYFGNTTDISNSIAYGPHDTHGGSNPYVGQSTENYKLA